MDAIGKIRLEKKASAKAATKAATVPQLTWRLAKAPDVDRIVALVNGAYRGDSGARGWTTEASLIGGQRTDRESLLAELARSESVILLATLETDANQILGCVHLERKGRACYLGMLTVDVDQQTGGVGSFLLATGESFAREVFSSTGIHMTVLSVRHELIEWYKRRGYNLSGETRPFPYGQERFGIPFVDGLYFEVLEKSL